MKVRVYGGDHSPWVNAVLLAVHEKGVEYSSIQVPPLEALQKDERLVGMRQWIANMPERFSDYSHLYSGRHFEPHVPQPEPAGPVQRAVFYFGFLTMVILFPITLPLVFVLMRKVPR